MVVTEGNDMSWKGFGLGLAAGIAVSVAWVTWRPRALPDGQITFPNMFLSEPTAQPQYDYVVRLIGTVTGDGLAYPNSTLTADCWRATMKCTVASVSQIAPTPQVGPVEVEEWTVQSWTPTMLSIFQDEECDRATINMDRRAQHVSEIVVPTHQSDALCEKADSQTRKYTIENSLSINLLNSKIKAKAGG